MLRVILVCERYAIETCSRKRALARVPVTLPDGTQVALSPGGQNPLIKAIIEQFCPAFAPGGMVLYIGDTENKFVHLESAPFVALGVTLDAAFKIPMIWKFVPQGGIGIPAQGETLGMQTAI